MVPKQNIVAIIPARGGSQGIPKKNIIDFCGKPLIAWSIKQALVVPQISSVWVTSDSDEILAVAQDYGARPIKRPEALSGASASSESAWLHAIDYIEDATSEIDLVLAMQATSPLRAPSDLADGIAQFDTGQYDSLLSVTEIEDFFIWRQDAQAGAQSVNYDYKSRKPRQNIEKRFLENGSFYLFRPRLLREENNRLGGRIGFVEMARHKMFQIDNPEDIILCSALMKSFELDQL